MNPSLYVLNVLDGVQTEKTLPGYYDDIGIFGG